MTVAQELAIPAVPAEALQILDTSTDVESMSDDMLTKQIRVAERTLAFGALTKDDRAIVEDHLVGLELELRWRMSSKSKSASAPSFLDLAISMNAGSTEAAAAIGAMLTRGTYIVEG